MAGSLGDNGGSDQTGKRPVPTIEGTATEVTVEPEDKESAAAKDTSEETPPDDEEAAGKTEDTEGMEDTEETGGTEPPETAEAPRRREGKSFAAAVLGGLVSFFSHVGAGLLGGLAVLAAIAWGYLPIGGAQAPDLTPLENRVATLEKAPALPDNSAALAELEAKVKALETRKPETPPEVTALADRVSQLEASLKSMTEAAKEGGSVADAAAISQQINEAEKRLDAKIDSSLADAKTANAQALDAMKKEIAAVEAKLKALAEAELDTGESGELQSEIAGIDERLSELEATIPSLLAAADKDAGAARAATLAIAFANLRAAVDDGRPYAAELATLAALSSGTGDLGGLLDYEDEGIPTVPQLTRSFEAAREAALGATPEPDGSLLDRLMASAESLVKLKRVDAEAEGDSPDAVLARAAAQLEQGNLAESVKEVETLKGAQRAAFADWLDQAHARLGADATLQKLQDILLVSIGGSGAPSQGDAQD
jgi:hypothetical protein